VIENLKKKIREIFTTKFRKILKKKIPAAQVTQSVKEWDAASGKNKLQIICTTSGEQLDLIDEPVRRNINIYWEFQPESSWI
jgi:hypothetical protein